MKRRGFLGKLIAGTVGVAVVPVATIEPKKIQATPTPKPDYTNITAGSVERMRIGSNGSTYYYKIY